jgi:hypothetical protein
VCANVADETKKAKDIAKSYFPAQGHLKTQLMRHWESPIEKSELKRLQSMAISIFGKGSPIPAKAKERQKADGAKTLLNLSPPILTVGGECGTNCLGIFLSDLAWFGMYRVDTSVSSKANGKDSSKKWEKCIQDVSAKSERFNPRAELHGLLRERLMRQGVESSAALFSEKDPLQEARKARIQYVLQIVIQNAGIHVRKAVYSYMSYRIQLLDAKANEVIFETDFGNTRKIDIKAFCREGGAELYKKEIVQELEKLVSRILPKAKRVRP